MEEFNATGKAVKENGKTYEKYFKRGLNQTIRYLNLRVCIIYNEI